MFIPAVAVGKLGARAISSDEAEQVLHNRHVIVGNVRGRSERSQSPLRRLLIGQTHGGRTLTLVIERTVDPTSWLLVTGWTSAFVERRLLRDTRQRQ